jgi:hypothetical protein
MTKRLIRYANLNEAIEQQLVIKQAASCAIILKSGEVHTGQILDLGTDVIVFKNRRLKKQEVPTNELSELIIDVKAT